MEKLLQWVKAQAPLLIACALVVGLPLFGFAAGMNVGHKRGVRSEITDLRARSAVCESAERDLIADRGQVVDNGQLWDVPNMPIQFFTPNDYVSGAYSGEWPSEAAAYRSNSGLVTDDSPRVGLIDIAPVTNTMYSMASLPRAASNMALAQAFARQFIKSVDATHATCTASTWVGPNLPGDVEVLDITDNNGENITAIIAIVGHPDARVLLFMRGNKQHPVDRDAVIQIGQAMHRVKR